MPAGSRVLAGVAVGRAVAAQRRAALLAGPQVDPLRPDLHALSTLPVLRVFYGRDGGEMRAGTGGRHRPHTAANLIDGGDGDRSLPDGARRALDTAAANVTHREHAGQTRFQQMGRPGERPARGSGAVVQRCVGFDADELNGDDLMKQSGVADETQQLKLGTLACSIDGEPAQFTECLPKSGPVWLRGSRPAVAPGSGPTPHTMASP